MVIRWIEQSIISISWVRRKRKYVLSTFYSSTKTLPKNVSLHLFSLIHNPRTKIEPKKHSFFYVSPIDIDNIESFFFIGILWWPKFQVKMFYFWLHLKSNLSKIDKCQSHHLKETKMKRKLNIYAFKKKLRKSKNCSAFFVLFFYPPDCPSI